MNSTRGHATNNDQGSAAGNQKKFLKLGQAFGRMKYNGLFFIIFCLNAQGFSLGLLYLLSFALIP